MMLLLLLYTNDNNDYHLVSTCDVPGSGLFPYRRLHRKPGEAYHYCAHRTDAEREALANPPGAAKW